MIPWLRILAVVGAVMALFLAFQGFKKQQREIGRQEVRAQAQAAADAQAARMRELQRAAELRYTVQAGVRERFITKTITEVIHASESLAACPVPADAVRLLDAARACAVGDPAAACGPGERVPGP